jgi:hypothetical protein
MRYLNLFFWQIHHISEAVSKLKERIDTNKLEPIQSRKRGWMNRQGAKARGRDRGQKQGAETGGRDKRIKDCEDQYPGRP